MLKNRNVLISSAQHKEIEIAQGSVFGKSISITISVVNSKILLF